MTGERRGRPRAEGLTPAEERVLAEVRQGRANAEIAVRLGISVNTVRYHVSNLLGKSGLKDRAELATWPGIEARRRRPIIAIGALALAGTSAAGIAAIAIVLTLQLVAGQHEEDGASGDPVATLSDFGPPVSAHGPAVRDYGAPPGGAGEMVLIAVWDGDGQSAVLRPVDAATGEDLNGFDPIDVAGFAGGVGAPDKSLLAVGPYVLDLVGWSTQELDAPAGYDTVDVWLPNGQTIVALRARGPRTDVTLIPADGGNSHVLSTLNFTVGGNLVLAPDATRLYVPGFETSDGYVTDKPGFVVAIDIATGAELGRAMLDGLLAGQLFEEDQGVGFYGLYSPAIAISPDGLRLYVAHAESSAITVIDTSTLEVVGEKSLRTPKSGWKRLRGWLAERLWDTAEAKGGPSRRPSVEVIGGGRYLALSGTTTEQCAGLDACWEGLPLGLRIVDAETLETVLAVPDVGAIAISEDGKTIVGVGTWQGPPVRTDGWLTLYGSGVTVVDLTSMTVRAVIEPGGRFEMPVITRDGRFALFLADGPALQRAMTNGGKCLGAACRKIVVVNLQTSDVVAERGLDSVAAQLVGGN
ncbi:MAG: LuxR C-terminal-related transcriptional regulator [Dehalococcoidia bacterium]